MSSDESTLTPEQIKEEKIKNQQEQIQKLSKALKIDRINEDISALREDTQKVSKSLIDLVTAINEARNPQPQEPSTKPIAQGEAVTREEMMMIVKDLGGIAADIFKTYKGTNSSNTNDGAYGNIIMQSLARAFQVHVDDIVYGTLQRLPPSAQTNYIPQPPTVQPINPVKAGFQK